MQTRLFQRLAVKNTLFTSRSCVRFTLNFETNNNCYWNRIIRSFCSKPLISNDNEYMSQSNMKRHDINSILSMVTKNTSDLRKAEFKRIWQYAKGNIVGISLSTLCFGLSGIFLFGGIANAGRVYSFSRVGHSVVKKISYVIRMDLFECITSQEIEFFDKTSTGELTTRLTADTNLIGDTFGGLQLAAALRNIVQFFGSFGIMLYLSPQLTSVMIGLIPLGIGGSIFYGRFVKKTQEATQQALSNSTSVAEEVLSQIRTVRLFANEVYEIDKYNKSVFQVFNLSMLQTKGSSIFFGISGMTGNLFLLGVLSYGAVLVTSGSITSGLLTSFLLYSVYVGMSVINITSAYTNLMRGIGASTRIFEWIDKKSEIDNNIGNDLPNDYDGSIRFENVRFRYPTRDNYVIFDNLSFEIPSGKSIAFVGESGSGKSSIISLLLKYYNIESGNIYFGKNNININTLSPNNIRNKIGVVSQSPVLFSGSIYDNISYSLQYDLYKVNNDINHFNNIDINRNLFKYSEESKKYTFDDSELSKEIIRVSKESNSHEFISEFPDGYNTILGENGVNLSGGQKQRISIARALLKQPKVLLLDEATSNLDANNEKLVSDALTKSIKNRSCIVIAHRLSTIKQCDLIYVLYNGNIIEKGTHDSLILNNNSKYKELIERQLYD